MGKQGELRPISLGPISLYRSLCESLVRHELRSGVRTGRAAPVRSDANERMGDRRLDSLVRRWRKANPVTIKANQQRFIDYIAVPICAVPVLEQGRKISWGS